MSTFEIAWLALTIVAWVVTMGLMATMLWRAGHPGGWRWLIAFVVALVVTGALGASGSVMFG